MAGDQSMSSGRDEIVLVLAPTGRDTPLACGLLAERAGILCEPCTNVGELCDRIRTGAGVVLLAEEAIDGPGARKLVETLATQLPWSDLPILVLAGNEADEEYGVSMLKALRTRLNITVLPRPARIVTLLSAVQSALRARRRQYEVRDLLAETRNAVRQRDQFLAMLGHELRNPLGAISNALTVIDMANPTADPIETEQRDIIRRQTEHLARLVDDLLDVSRITTGKIALQKRTVDLCELAKRAVRSVEVPARAQSHELIINVAREPILIDADPVRMEQVVNNLLTNAIKYTPPGGRVELNVSGTESSAMLSVRDNGMGMPSELLPRVFELFTQSDRALDRSQGGLGIGLTLVRSLVEMHDGSVSVHSDGVGKGSEFMIELPRVASAKVEPQAPPAAPPHVNGSRRVLVVEDQPDARRALQRLLQIWGHEVEVASDGPGGVQAASKCAPDVALVDVGLPGLDGYEVARRIRAQHGDRVRLIALTGYGQPEDRERAYNAGFDLHLVKPVDREQLARSVSDATNGAAQP